MSTLRNLNVNLELGQTILVGQNREPAQITKIEFHEKSGKSKSIPPKVLEKYSALHLHQMTNMTAVSTRLISIVRIG